MYFPISIIIWIVRHDVGCHVHWFALWGVLCHSTVTKILKLSCADRRRTTSQVGIKAVVDLHEQSICQTTYDFNVVSRVVLNRITIML